jgi:hypothetical protein
MNASYCSQLGLKSTTQDGTITTADGLDIPIKGRCSAKIVVQDYPGEVLFLVADLAPQWQVILGDTWFNATKAQMDFESKCIRLLEHKVSLQADSRTQPSGQTIPVLSCMQAKRALKTRVASPF